MMSASAKNVRFVLDWVVVCCLRDLHWSGPCGAGKPA